MTQDQPLISFVRADVEPPFEVGHVKGLARICTFLLPIACVWLESKTQPSLKLEDFFPKLVGTGCKIMVRFERHTTRTELAIRNAQLSQRGALRKAHDAVTWVGTLTY